MTMPSDAADAVPSAGSDEGPRGDAAEPRAHDHENDPQHPDPQPTATVDEENVPRPGAADGR